ncbi:hypothetical protein AAY473_001272 [Plecturocebus cupreus]
MFATNCSISPAWGILAVHDSPVSIPSVQAGIVSAEHMDRIHEALLPQRLETLLRRPWAGSFASSPRLSRASSQRRLVPGQPYADSPSHSAAQAGVQPQSWLTLTSASQVQVILLPQPPDRDMLHHVGQAALELLTSSDPPTSASHSAQITGMSHVTSLFDKISICTAFKSKQKSASSLGVRVQRAGSRRMGVLACSTVELSTPSPGPKAVTATSMKDRENGRRQGSGAEKGRKVKQGAVRDKGPYGGELQSTLGDAVDGNDKSDSASAKEKVILLCACTVLHQGYPRPGRHPTDVCT